MLPMLQQCQHIKQLCHTTQSGSRPLARTRGLPTSRSAGGAHSSWDQPAAATAHMWQGGTPAKWPAAPLLLAQINVAARHYTVSAHLRFTKDYVGV